MHLSKTRARLAKRFGLFAYQYKGVLPRRPPTLAMSSLSPEFGAALAVAKRSERVKPGQPSMPADHGTDFLVFRLGNMLVKTIFSNGLLDRDPVDCSYCRALFQRHPVELYDVPLRPAQGASPPADKMAEALAMEWPALNLSEGAAHRMAVAPKTAFTVTSSGLLEYACHMRADLDFALIAVFGSALLEAQVPGSGMYRLSEDRRLFLARAWEDIKAEIRATIVPALQGVVGGRRYVYLLMGRRLAHASQMSALVLDLESTSNPGIYAAGDGFYPLHSTNPQADYFAWLLSSLIMQREHERILVFSVTYESGWAVKAAVLTALDTHPAQHQQQK